jgi:hypothetical protein
MIFDSRMPVGLVSVSLVIDLLTILHVQMHLLCCRTAPSLPFHRVEEWMLVENDCLGGSRLHVGVCMLETISKGSPDCGNPRDVHWLSHRNDGSTLLNPFTTDHLASARGTPL